jgi:hypothetical protein
MTKHTCSYCDGTLKSTRPLCLNCGHPLCLEIRHSIRQDYMHDVRGIVILAKEQTGTTLCPKCRGVNELAGVDDLVVGVTWNTDEL